MVKLCILVELTSELHIYDMKLRAAISVAKSSQTRVELMLYISGKHISEKKMAWFHRQGFA